MWSLPVGFFSATPISELDMSVVSWTPRTREACQGPEILLKIEDIFTSRYEGCPNLYGTPIPKRKTLYWEAKEPHSYSDWIFINYRLYQLGTEPENIELTISFILSIFNRNIFHSITWNLQDCKLSSYKCKLLSTLRVIPFSSHLQGNICIGSHRRDFRSRSPGYITCTV